MENWGRGLLWVKRVEQGGYFRWIGALAQCLNKVFDKCRQILCLGCRGHSLLATANKSNMNDVCRTPQHTRAPDPALWTFWCWVWLWMQSSVPQEEYLCMGSQQEQCFCLLCHVASGHTIACLLDNSNAWPYTSFLHTLISLSCLTCLSRALFVAPCSSTYLWCMAIFYCHLRWKGDFWQGWNWWQVLRIHATSTRQTHSVKGGHPLLKGHLLDYLSWISKFTILNASACCFFLTYWPKHTPAGMHGMSFKPFKQRLTTLWSIGLMWVTGFGPSQGMLADVFLIAFGCIHPCITRSSSKKDLMLE